MTYQQQLQSQQYIPRRDKLSPVHDLFHNELRVIVYKNETGDDSAIQLIRTKTPQDYSLCTVRLSNPEHWRIVRNILAQLNYARTITGKTYYCVTCCDKACTKISYFARTDGKGYLTQIAVCRYSEKPPQSLITVPAANQPTLQSPFTEQLVTTPPIPPPPDPYNTQQQILLPGAKKPWFHDVQTIILEDEHVDYLLREELLKL